MTRYAPSPTGYLHLGHVAHMIWLWGAARHLGARILLRMEDRDRIRCKPEYERAILDDTAWLGFRADNELAPLYRQSDNDAVYRGALAALRETGCVYRCACSRKDIARHSPLSPAGERVYSGFCRNRDVPQSTAHGLRVALEPVTEAFDDLLLGPQSQTPASQCGDLLLRERQQQWTYQFAVTVDDLRHGVNLVIRGADLLESTGRQIQLARMLGREQHARFLHHPLIHDVGGEKLSKRRESLAVRAMRDAGATPAWILGEAAYAVGLLERPRELAQDDLPGLVAGRVGALQL